MNNLQEMHVDSKAMQDCLYPNEVSTCSLGCDSHITTVFTCIYEHRYSSLVPMRLLPPSAHRSYPSSPHSHLSQHTRQTRSPFDCAQVVQCQTLDGCHPCSSAGVWPQLSTPPDCPARRQGLDPVHRAAWKHGRHQLHRMPVTIARLYLHIARVRPLHFYRVIDSFQIPWPASRLFVQTSVQDQQQCINCWRIPWQERDRIVVEKSRVMSCPKRRMLYRSMADYLPLNTAGYHWTLPDIGTVSRGEKVLAGQRKKHDDCLIQANHYARQHFKCFRWNQQGTSLKGYGTAVHGIRMV